MTSQTIKLPLARYRLWFQAHTPVTLPRFAGSTWRGTLGHALKKAVCVTRQPHCRSCMLLHACAHAYIFETPPSPGAGKMRKYTAAPHPFVLSPPDGPHQLSPGDEYPLDLTLIGQGNRHLPYVIHALSLGARNGIGKTRGALELIRVDQAVTVDAMDLQTIFIPGQPVQTLPALTPSIPATPKQPITLTLHTPLRLKRDGHTVQPDEFHFADLFSNLLRRVSMLSYFHTDTPLDTDFAQLTQAARAWQADHARLQWQSWQRYSSRQKAHVNMDGLTGQLTLPHEGIEPFWPYLWLGQFIHAGAGTVMGQGRYQLASLPFATQA